ncbi:MAG: IclR family acetate operon transcriptional repressor [Paracoccaceae bacterium]|jgi:IclR family acetate operon transcriptional repressor
MTEMRKRGRPRAFHDNTAQNTIQSLDRAMMILTQVSVAGGSTLTKLATELDQSPATVYRVLSTLEARDIVEMEPISQTWHVGAGAFRIGSSFLRRTNLVERARPLMQELMIQTGETANLGVRSADQVLFVSQVETHATIRAFFPPGTMSLMHASGIGKALMAQMAKPEIDRLLSAVTLTQFTTKTICDPDALRCELGLIRERGYSIDDEERNEGMRCVAAPVFNALGVAVAGISVSGPTSRVRHSEVDTFAQHVKAAATGLSAALGASERQ